MVNHDAEQLLEALWKTERSDDFKPILQGIREVLMLHGIEADRVQIPVIQPLGFRDPKYWGVILTWRKHEGAVDEEWVEHEVALSRGLPNLEGDSTGSASPRRLPRSPYWTVSEQKSGYFRTHLETADHGYPILDRLQKEGLKDYCCLGLQIPGTDLPALVSIASEASFPDDLYDRIESLRAILSLCLYGAYRGSQARQIARTYIGARTGPRVLEGANSRGSAQTLEAGIMFCDLRGFTALSEQIGTRILPLMNTVFDAVGDEVEKQGGEILKFIGDAMLIVFGLDGRSTTAVSQAMVATVQASLERVEALSRHLAEPVAVGFGCHVGQVIYGNVGTSERLDFTVLGPAVNLASRLEGLCKELRVPAVFSQTIQGGAQSLNFGGVHRVKGLTKPVPVWLLPQAMRISAIPQ